MRRQRYPRARPAESEPVEIQIIGEGFLDILHARDISRGGVGLYVPHGFAGCNLDQEVELVVTLPRVRPFRARGRIRHRTEYRGDCFFGVEFCGLASADRAEIGRYVARRLKEQTELR